MADIIAPTTSADSALFEVSPGKQRTLSATDLTGGTVSLFYSNDDADTYQAAYNYDTEEQLVLTPTRPQIQLSAGKYRADKSATTNPCAVCISKAV